MNRSKNPYSLPPHKDWIWETNVAFFKFGYTNFGGSMVHTITLNNEVIIKCVKVSQAQFAELLAVPQSLP
ncbi:hypothetical protein BGZ97_009728, partial [Linnemannia gamsii]